MAYKSDKTNEDKETTIRNIYRVLLSRGRIGIILYCNDYQTLRFFEQIDIEKI